MTQVSPLRKSSNPFCPVTPNKTGWREYIEQQEQLSSFLSPAMRRIFAGQCAPSPHLQSSQGAKPLRYSIMTLHDSSLIPDQCKDVFLFFG